MRLNKYIAKCGVASRRKADELIKLNRVTVNGKYPQDIGMDVDEGNDIIMIDGKNIKFEEKKVYILLNKPTGYITTVKDEFSRKNVIDIIKDIKERVYPVGRLDYDTSGLLILTNDGDLTYKLTHPKHEISKIYIATLKGIPDDKDIKAFENGLKIEDYITSPAKFKILNILNNTSICEIEIHEGKNRQVRKMCSAIGHNVLKLKREKIGKIEVKNLKEGSYRFLTDEEINYLKTL